MLYYLTWPNDASLLVDVADRDTALEAGRATVKEEPATCRLFPPGTFAVRCYFEDESDDGTELISLEPLDHVFPVLQLFEDELDDKAAAEAEAAGLHVVIGDGNTSTTAPTEPPPPCLSVGAAPDGSELICEAGEVGHEPPHKSGQYEWEDE